MVARHRRRRMPSAPPAAPDDERPRDLLHDKPDAGTIAKGLTPRMRDTLRLAAATHFRPIPNGRRREILALVALNILRRDQDGDVTITEFGLAVRRFIEGKRPVPQISPEEVPY